MISKSKKAGEMEDLLQDKKWCLWLQQTSKRHESETEIGSYPVNASVYYGHQHHL